VGRGRLDPPPRPSSAAVALGGGPAPAFAFAPALASAFAPPLAVASKATRDPTTPPTRELCATRGQTSPLTPTARAFVSVTATVPSRSPRTAWGAGQRER